MTVVKLTRPPRKPAEELTEEEYEWLWGQSEFMYFSTREPEELWEKFGADVVASWLKEKPGTRPPHWWSYTAPRMRKVPRYWRRYSFCEPRVSVGGPFKTVTDVYPATVPTYPLGLPRIGEYEPDNLPAFESQATYLKRHALFADGEEKRVPPEGWEPEQWKPEDE